MYSKTTNFFKVTVLPFFQENLSNHEDQSYVWEYEVFVENLSDNVAQLVGRYWKIINAEGKTNEIRGKGVVGQQPILRSGEAFNYKSQVQLSTPSGIMLGKYKIKCMDTQTEVEIDIPPFSLDSVFEDMKVN